MGSALLVGLLLICTDSRTDGVFCWNKFYIENNNEQNFWFSSKT